MTVPSLAVPCTRVLSLSLALFLLYLFNVNNHRDKT